MVTQTERAMRAMSAVDLMPGSGRNTNTPPIRASVTRKPSRVAMESCSSPCIAAQVPQDRHGVRHELLKHPGQRQDEGRQEGAETRNGVEPAVLNRSDNLDQTDDDARRESHGEQRSRQPERSHQGLPQNLD